MVNSTATVSLILLVLLSLAVFLAVYYTGAGAGKSINGLGEFTIQLNAPHGLGASTAATGYSLGAYSNLKVDAKSGAITSWTFSAITSWQSGEQTVASVQSNGVMYRGLVAEGVLTVNECFTYSTAALTTQALGASFLAPTLTGVNADGSKNFAVNLRGKAYTVITAANGTPLSASAVNEDYTVTSFDANANTLVIPTIDQNGIVCTDFAVEEKRSYNEMSVAQKKFADTQAAWSPATKAKYSQTQVEKMFSKYCNASWKGDGVCDAVCNNAESNFDNGDCKVVEAQYMDLDYYDASSCESMALETKNGVTTQCGADTGGESYFNGGGFGTYTAPRARGSCSFLHGAGQDGIRPYDVFTSATRIAGRQQARYYWGTDFESSGVCGSYSFIWTDTDNKDYGWEDWTHHASYYSVASNNEVNVAHSMGNMILAGACLFRGWCGVSWYASAGPYKGTAMWLSMLGWIAYLLGGGNDTDRDSMKDGPYSFASLAGYYNKGPMGRSLFHGGLLDGVRHGGAMTGTTGWASGRANFFMLWVLCQIAKGDILKFIKALSLIPYIGFIFLAIHTFLKPVVAWYNRVFGLFAYISDNDGMVPIESSDFNGSAQGNSENWSRYYKDGMNHQDVTGSNGDWDPWIGGDGFPVKWTVNALKRGA